MRATSAAREPGLRGGRQKGKKVLVGIAVERTQPMGFGRCRMAPLVDASGDSLRAFLTDNVEPGATVITDGWQSYRPATQGLYVHQPIPGASGADAAKLLPAVHKVASLAKRWLLGTHQGSVDAAHLPGYLNEFVFRFNRRRSRSRGLVFYRVLELAVNHDPVRYGDLIASPRPGTGRSPRPAPAATRRAWSGRPPSDRGEPDSPPAPLKWIPHTGVSCSSASRTQSGMRAKQHQVKDELKRRRHHPIPEQGQWLASVVRGHLAYYAVPGNRDAVAAFRSRVTRDWHEALRRRSQRLRLDWDADEPHRDAMAAARQDHAHLPREAV